MSRVCEEFHCTPAVAEQELEHDADRVFEILGLRAYAKAKAAYDGIDRLSKNDRAQLRADPLVQLVMETEFEITTRELLESHERPPDD